MKELLAYGSKHNSTKIAPSTAKKVVAGSAVAILIIILLGFPQPIGFETRPQADVSMIWAVLCIAIFASLLATIRLVFTRPSTGAKLGILAGILTILQSGADQAHLMQPEAVPLACTALEGLSVIASLVLIYCAWIVFRAFQHDAIARNDERQRSGIIAKIAKRGEN